MKSATKEVCDSGSSDDEPLAVKKSSLHQTEEKNADYILQRNESFKRKAENQAEKQKRNNWKKGCWQKRKEDIHWSSSIKEARKQWKKKEKKERGKWKLRRRKA